MLHYMIIVLSITLHYLISLTVMMCLPIQVPSLISSSLPSSLRTPLVHHQKDVFFSLYVFCSALFVEYYCWLLQRLVHNINEGCILTINSNLKFLPFSFLNNICACKHISYLETHHCLTFRLVI